MSKRDERAASLASVNDGKHWENLRPVEKDEYRRQATREGFRDDYDPTCASDAVGEAMRSRLDRLAVLVKIGNGEDSSRAEREAVDLAAAGEDDADGGWDVQQEAQDRLHEFPLAVETMTTFEIVLGTGGPDDRILIECRTEKDRAQDGDTLTTYEIRRVLYRYSWSGSAEVELVGEDREVAEAFAREVVPELVE